MLEHCGFVPKPQTMVVSFKWLKDKADVGVGGMPEYLCDLIVELSKFEK